MPTSVGTSVFILAAILIALSPVAAAIVATVAVCWEIGVFALMGIKESDE